MKPPFAFKQHGAVRPLGAVGLPAPGPARRRHRLPHVGQVEDERPRPGQLHDEHRLHRCPASRAWARGSRYGLGRLTDNLPTFVVLPDPRGLPYNDQGNFSSGFLPVVHQGTVIRPTAPTPIADLHPPDIGRSTSRPASEARRPRRPARDEPRPRRAPPGRLAARSPHRRLRAGRADAARRPGGARPVARDRRPSATSTASTTR